MMSADNLEAKNRIITFRVLPWSELAKAWSTLSIVLFVVLFWKEGLNFQAALLAKLQLFLGRDISDRAWASPAGKDNAYLGDLIGLDLSQTFQSALVGLGISAGIALICVAIWTGFLIILQLRTLVLSLREQIEEFPILSENYDALLDRNYTLEDTNSQLKEALSVAIRQRDAALSKGPLDGWIARRSR